MPLKKRLRRRLLCTAPTSSATAGLPTEFAYSALHFKLLAVRLAPGTNDCVGWKRLPSSLQNFLKPCLAVLGHFRVECLDTLRKKATDDAICGMKPAVEEHRTNQCLESVAKDRCFGGTPSACFTGAKPKIGPELKIERHRVQNRGAHQTCPQTRKLALVALCEPVEQHHADHKAQHCVTEKLQAFVVWLPEATVCQCLLEQRLLREVVAERLFEAPQGERSAKRCERLINHRAQPGAQ